MECIYSEVVDTVLQLVGLREELDATEVGLGDLETRIAGAEGAAGSLDLRVSLVEADVDALYDELGVVAGEMAGQETEIGVVVNKVDVVLAKLDVVERGKLSRTVTSCTVTDVIPQGTNTCHFKWTAAHCAGGVPVGACEGFVTWAQHSGDDEDWRVMVPGEEAAGQTFTDGGMVWWNDNGCSNGGLAIRATYLCEVPEE